MPAAIASIVRMLAANVVSPNALCCASTATIRRDEASAMKVMNSWISVVTIER